MSTLTINNNQFEQSFTLTKQNNNTFHFDTAGTFVDKDIDLTMNVRPATATMYATGATSISDLSFTYNSTTGNFAISGSSNITGTAILSITQAGWINTGITAAVAGSASLGNASVDKIGLSSTTAGTLKVTPTISKQSVPSGVTNAANGDATATTPASGVYVAVRSAGTTASAYVIPIVASNGYGTIAVYNTSTATLVVGANQSNITYIPIKPGTAVTPATTIAQAPSFTITTATGEIVASYNSSKKFPPTVTAGWISTGTTGTVTTTGSASLTLPTVGVEVLENQVSLTPGWIGSTTAYSITAGSAITPATTIAQAPTITVATATGVITAKYNKSQSVTPTVTPGYITSGTAGTISTTGSNTLTLPTASVAITDDEISLGIGWIGATTALNVTAGSASTPATTIAKAPTITVATATGVITAKYNSSKSITPTVVAGWVNSGTAGTVSTTGSNTLTLGAAGISISGKTITLTPGWIGATTSQSVDTVFVTRTNATVSGTNFIQGVLSVPTGWVTATTVSGATFANSGSSGTTYLDISDTTGAPILVSGDYLYVNKGYTDNIKISLAKLVPDEASVLLADEHILSGYSAYNNNGVLVAGNIPSKDETDITITTNNIVVPSGYYSTTAAVMIDEGQYSAGIGLSAVTVTPSVSISSASTYGFSTSEPSSGTYITVNPGADSPTYSATGTATITQIGYVGLGNKKAGTSATVKVAAGNNYYALVVTPSFSGGGLTVNTNTNTVSTTPVVTLSATGTFLTTGTATYGVTLTKPSGTDGTAFLTIDGKGTVSTTGVATSSVKMTAGAVTYSNTAGVIASHSGSSAYNGTNTTTGTTTNIIPGITDNFNPIYIPIVTTTFSGGGLTVNTNTNTVSTTPVVTISSSGSFLTTGTSTYGVTATQPAGTDGTNYLKIDGAGTVSTNGVVSSSVKVTRAAVNYNNAPGAIAVHTATQAVASGSTTTGTTAEVVPTITDNFDPLYIPIVTTTFSGGGLTVNTNSNTVTAVPVVTLSATGTFLSTGTGTYGVTATQPTGTNGTNYLTIDGKGEVTTTGKVQSSVKITRAQVNYNNAAGAIAAHSGATAINATSTTTGTTVDVTPTITDNFSPWYMPIVTTTFSGGGLTVNTNTNTVTATPVVTVSATGTFSTASAYGVTSTKPTGTDGTNFLSIDGKGTVTTTGVVVSSVKVTRAQVNYNNAAGAIAAHSSATAVNATSTTTGTSVKVVPTVTDSFAPLYIPIVTTTFAGGGLSASTTNVMSTNMSTTSSGTYYVDAVATTTAARAQVNYNNAAGAITTHTSATAINATSTNLYSTATRVYIPTAKFTSSTTWSGNLLSTSFSESNLIKSTSDSYNNNIKLVATATLAEFKYITKSTSAGYIAAATTAIGGSVATQSQNSTYYIQGVTINKPASGEAKFSLTIPNGADDMITFVFHVDASGNVVVNDSTDNAFT